MNINDFDKHIEQKILARGIDYYKDGNIISLEYDDDENTWAADVEGTEDYRVTVTLEKNGDVLDTHCDCPYEFGNHCKHQVAVFYALRKQLNSKDNNEKSKTKKSKVVKFENIIEDIDKDELVPFLISYAKKSKQFKSEFMLTFANRFFDKTTVFENARTLIKSSFVGISRDDYIGSSKGAKATEGADKVLEIAKQEKSLYTAVKLCFIVMEEMLSASNKYYDNNGYFDDTAKESIGIISEKFSAFSPENEEFKSAFELTMDFLPKIAGGIEPYEIQTDIVKILIPFCTIDYVRQDVEKCLKTMSERIGSNGYSSNYYQKLIQQLQYSIISLCDGESDASIFAHDHLDNSDFRKMIIEQSIEKKDYKKALMLCMRGEKKDVDHQGLVSDWKELRYRIYEITGDTAGQKKLAYEFTIDGDFDYYIKLKKLYRKNSKDWQSEFKKVIEAVSVPYDQDIYTRILVTENMKPELLEYCKKHVASIPEYYLYLLHDYQREVDKLFLELLRKRAANADSRYLYKEICDLIQKYAKACGNEKAEIIIQEFKVTYPKRPAFMEELGKLRLGRGE